MPAYEVTYKTSWGRCVWCWDELSRTETHTVVTALTAPLQVLQLHHACFENHRYNSGLELAAEATNSKQLKPGVAWKVLEQLDSIGANVI